MAPPKHNTRAKETEMKLMKSIKTKIGTAPLLLFLAALRVPGGMRQIAAG